MPELVTITVEQKKICEEKRESYLTRYDSLTLHETQEIQNITNNVEYLQLATSALECCSLQIAVGYLNEHFLVCKWDDRLLTARKDLVRCMQYLEKVYTMSLDTSFSEYEKEISNVYQIDEFERYNFLKYVGFYINFLSKIFCLKEKWNHFFVEMEGQLSILLKNSFNFRHLKQLLDPRAEHYKERFEVVNLMRELLRKSAQAYRTHYEITSSQISDFRRAIDFLSAAKRVDIFLNNLKGVEELDREITVWKSKLRNDDLKRNKETL